MASASCEASVRPHRRRSPNVAQVDEAQVAEVLPPQAPVVRSPFALELHAPDTHVYPAVQVAKQAMDTGERGGEIVRGTAYHSVDFRDDVAVQIVFPNG